MSVEVTIETAGAEEYAQALQRFDSAMQTRVHMRLAEWAETVKTEAAQLVPVRTGYLRSSIYARTQEWQAEVGVEAVYAAQVEFGSRYAQAKPFFQPAVQQHLHELEGLLLQAVDSAKTEANL
jgi:HK97 gp10 family phage protein